MKSLLLFILLLIAQFCLSQNSKIKKVICKGEEYYLYPERQSSKFNNSLNYWKENIIRKKYAITYEENIDGKWIQYYEEDTTKPAKIFSLKNNSTEGEYIQYYLNGQTELIEHYTKGHENGLSIRWYNNGQVKDTTIYKYDSSHYYPQVIHKRTFYESGVLKKVELYDTNGIKNGIWTEYYDNGQLNIKQEFSNKVRLESLLGMHYFGNILGDYLCYYKNGQLMFKLAFNNGKMVDGLFNEYYENGNTKQYGELKEGLRDGEWIELYENGDLKSKGNYFSSSYRACGRQPYTAYYEYKTGTWEYYYLGQKLMATNVQISV